MTGSTSDARVSGLVICAASTIATGAFVAVAASAARIVHWLGGPMPPSENQRGDYLAVVDIVRWGGGLMSGTALFLLTLAFSKLCRRGVESTWFPRRGGADSL